MSVETASIREESIVLRPEKKSSNVLEFEERLRGKIIGQNEAVEQLVSVYQMIQAGMTMPGRPIANLLFLGPTGSGKTRVVEAAAEILFGSPNSFIKVDCAEFQHAHEIARLIGSPPGYIGHRETTPVLAQEAIDQLQTEKAKFTLVLFDEIEKASDALWQLLLGILDKATLTLGDNRKTDFSRTIIFMTSNLGSEEMSRLVSGAIGFAPKPTSPSLDEFDRKICRVAVDAAKRRFSPEFMNRIDKVVVFHTLNADQLRKILDVELSYVQKRILEQADRVFVFRCMDDAKEFLLKEGTDTKYGARHLKRAIERHLVFPLSNLISTGQVQAGDNVMVDLAEDGGSLTFSKRSATAATQSGGLFPSPEDCDSPPGNQNSRAMIRRTAAG
jgi:ATP-dependent Clp protease ATP-binding subunit ClpA